MLKGFKSIKTTDLELRPLNVLIGANGAGKSNLISFFKMLNEMMAGRLQQYIATTGRAQSILHYGPKQTPEMEATLEFQTNGAATVYHLKLSYVVEDALAFVEESVGPGPNAQTGLGVGHRETNLGDTVNRGSKPAQTAQLLLNQCRVYHFNDTSVTARVRQYCYIGNNRWLLP